MLVFKIYLLFWIFAFLGWIMEVVVCSLDDKQLVNRGFLLGPYCPIYGFGGIIMLTLAPYRESPLICFVLAMVICSIVEYVASYLMEKIFKVRWWDYSKDSFNINGRICLRNSIAFGLLGMLFASYLNPIFLGFISKLSNSTLILISSIVFLITSIDIIISLNAMGKIKKVISKNLNVFANRDATSDIKKMIHSNLFDKGYLEKRILRTYHILEKSKDELLERFENFKDQGYSKFTWAILIGFFLGLVIGFFTKHYRLALSLSISFCVFLEIIIIHDKKKR